MNVSDEFNSQAKALTARLDDEIFEGRLVFPTAFDLTLRIKRLADDPDSSLSEISKVVSAEPLLSARVVRLANAVMLNPYGETVSSVADAVRRIGLATLRCLSFAIAAEQLSAEQRTPECKAIGSGLWLQSADVACWASAIAKESRCTRPDTALFAGMMINIGQFFLLSKGIDHPVLPTQPTRFAGFILDNHLRVRDTMLEALGLPDEVLDAWHRAGTLPAWPPTGLAECVTVARLQSKAPNPLERLAERSAELVPPATRTLHEENRADPMLEAAKAQQGELLGAFSG